MAVILVVRTALSDFDLYWTRVICVAPHMIIHEYEAHAWYERGSEEFIVTPMYSAKLSKENSGAK
jgi:hypothetical protein